MGKIEKLIEKIKANPRHVRFEDLLKALKDKGYDIINIKGSHYSFSDGKTTITIVRPHGGNKFCHVLDVKEGDKEMFTIEDYEIIIFPSPEKEEHWLYLRFPDIPEILTGGKTIEEAIENAKEAFECHKEALQKQGKELPVPTSRTVHT
ncbi:MAG TPA: hypothetical protein DEP99_02900 [Nitrospiraceae bacterium]|nr:hypothetical protein [Nitrospiraceae bacterium]